MSRSGTTDEPVDLDSLPVLPSGWKWCLASDICRVIASGSTPTSDKMFSGNGDIPFLKVYNLTHNGTLDFSVKPTFIDENTHTGLLARSRVLSGDVLINIVGPPLGKVSVVPTDYSEWNINQAIVLFRPCDGISNKYLAQACLTDSIMMRLTSRSKATAGQHNIGVGMCRSMLPIPVAPTDEQRRIVAKIEELFSDLDAGVAALKRAKAKLKRYRAAVLKAAVGGQLTEEWRAKHPPKETASQLLERILKERRRKWEEDQLAIYAKAGKKPPTNWKDKYKEPAAPDETDLPALPNGWCWATVERTSQFARYGSSAKASSEPDGVPVLRMGNIQDGSLDLTNLKYLPNNHSEFPDLLLQLGDLLFNRTNSAELVGKSAVYQSQPSPCSYASYLIAVRFVPGCESKYVSYFLNSSYGRGWIASVVSQQVGQANVNGTKLQALAFPLPPLDEQQQIVSEVEQRLSIAQESESQIEANLKRSSRLRQSILKRAFEGNLVPQDPSDEPASVLLERIKVSTKKGNLKTLARPARKIK